MLRQIETTRNADTEAVLLARVYRLILSWSDDGNTNEPRLKEKTAAPAPTDPAPRNGGEHVTAN